MHEQLVRLHDISPAISNIVGVIVFLLIIVSILWSGFRIKYYREREEKKKKPKGPYR